MHWVSCGRSRDFTSRLFRPAFDAAHHLLLHNEMGRLKYTVMDKRTEQAWLPIPSPANDETHMVRVDILEEKPPKPWLFRIAPKHERVHRLADQSRQRRCVRMEPDFVSHLDLLELGQDAVCVAQVASDEILQPRIAVEPALVLAQLNEPGPDGSCR